MNEVLRRRLTGLAVLLLALFVLSWFVPGGDERGLEPGTPSTLVPLAGVPAGEPAPPETAATDLPPSADLTRPTPTAPAPVEKPAPKPAPAVVVDHLAVVAKPPAAVAARPPVATAAKPASETPADKPAAAAKPSGAPASGWWIQIGSYGDHGKAETVLSLLRGIGYHGEITPVPGHKAPLNRVRLGPYASEDTARTALARVARQGYPQAQVVPADEAKPR